MVYVLHISLSITFRCTAQATNPDHQLECRRRACYSRKTSIGIGIRYFVFQSSTRCILVSPKTICLLSPGDESRIPADSSGSSVHLLVEVTSILYLFKFACCGVDLAPCLCITFHFRPRSPSSGHALIIQESFTGIDAFTSMYTSPPTLVCTVCSLKEGGLIYYRSCSQLCYMPLPIIAQQRRFLLRI
ncbi:hypothetical protein BDN70DRAFT_363704 [Pholiota conissans]|uniref:Secreted protein n=1 Tax=Pholiota conissans TaxID=109636 RepID=A0A9P5YS09_9AGAR|nr:hypothetical protein BDN70DRAFT_363704 [Pholiota conissans]